MKSKKFIDYLLLVLISILLIIVALLLLSNNTYTSIGGRISEKMEQLESNWKLEPGTIPQDVLIPVGSADFFNGPTAFHDWLDGSITHYCTQHGTAWVSFKDEDREFAPGHMLSELAHANNGEDKAHVIQVDEIDTDQYIDATDFVPNTIDYHSNIGIYDKDMGLADNSWLPYVFAVYQKEQSRPCYKNDAVQQAVWNYLGQGGDNTLRIAGETMAKYYGDAHAYLGRNPQAASSAGAEAVLKGGKCIVGPFIMGNYVSASNYTVTGSVKMSGGKTAEEPGPSYGYRETPSFSQEDFERETGISSDYHEAYSLYSRPGTGWGWNWGGNGNTSTTDDEEEPKGGEYFKYLCQIGPEEYARMHEHDFFYMDYDTELEQTYKNWYDAKYNQYKEDGIAKAKQEHDERISKYQEEKRAHDTETQQNISKSGGVTIQEKFGGKYIGGVTGIKEVTLQGKKGTKTTSSVKICKDQNGTPREMKGQVPDPGETFYLSIPFNEVEGYETLKKIEFCYQIIGAKGTLLKCVGTQGYVALDQTTKEGCTSYVCSKGHTSSTPGTCGATITENEEVPNSDGKGTHTETHTSTCGETLRCSAHGYANCRRSCWKVIDKNEDCAQDGGIGSGRLVKEPDNGDDSSDKPNGYPLYANVNVPVLTRVGIYKQIKEVKHANGSAAEGGGDRESASPTRMQEKEGNPVKVEKGDIIIYDVILENTSTNPARVLVKDTLPGQVALRNGGGLTEGSYVEVGANSRKKIEVEVQTLADDGLFTNKVEILSRNAGPEFPTSGGKKIINEIEEKKPHMLIDSDTYLIKKYKINIDKHIVKVEHVTNKVDTFSGNRANGNGKGSAVYVEYGDRVYYEVDIYNTSEQDYNSLGGASYASAPFYKPEYVNVSVADTLPRKCSHVENAVNGTYRVPANGKITLQMSLVVEEVERGTIDTNYVKITGVTNINDFDVPQGILNIETPEKMESEDSYILNDYNIDIDKYVSYYDDVMIKHNPPEVNPFNNKSDYTRMKKGDEWKEANQVLAEKGTILTYSIRMQNLSKEDKEKNKPATQVRVSEVIEQIPPGLEILKSFAEIYREDGTGRLTEKDGNAIEIVVEDGKDGGKILAMKNNEYNLETLLDPGEYIIFRVQVEVTKSNMYLYTIENVASAHKLTNVNNRITESNEKEDRDVTKQNITKLKESHEYIRMKDLVLSGIVWVDTNRDGYFTNGEQLYKGIKVNLYNAKTDELLDSAYTNEDGRYSFGRVYKARYKIDGTETIGTIPEAGKTELETGYYNLTEEKLYDPNKEEFNEYYIEFEFNGVYYKSTTNYSGNTHLNDHWLPNDYRKNDNSIEPNEYEIDSNAYEFKDVRERFNRSTAIVAYNKEYAENTDMTTGGETTDIVYDKSGHISTLLDEKGKIETARAFVKGKGLNESVNNTNKLWFYFLDESKSHQMPETEYTKYINLGLEPREGVDIGIEKDLFQIKTTINGEPVIYDYNQEESNGEYNNSYISRRPYDFNIYESDYMYRVEQYENSTVRGYKGIESELNVEVTFRIAITNQSYNHFRKVNAAVALKELADYYDINFKKFNNSDETVTIKAKNGDYLVDSQIKVAEAWYEDENTPLRELTLSNTSVYNENRTFDGYNTLYIRGFNDIKLKEGQTGYVYVKYVLDKDSARTLKITDDKRIQFGNGDEVTDITEGISEVSAFTSWYDNDIEEYTAGVPAGLTDRDSNPGNIGDDDGRSDSAPRVGVDDFRYYEDDTYKSGVRISIADNIRNISGFVWNDSRSENITADGTNQYTGNGVYSENEQKNASAKSNPYILRLLNLDRYTQIIGKYANRFIEAESELIQALTELNLEKDFRLNGLTAELVEIVKIPDGAGGTRYYEQKLNANWNRTFEQLTNSWGEYRLNGFIPGYYIVRFHYGNSTTNEMLTFNGQDYKSTKYMTGVDNITLTDNNEDIRQYDTIMNALETDNRSDARDDELRRLETIAYSETMTNQKAETLKGIESIDKDTFVDKTKMNAETVTFYVKPEKLNNESESYSARTNIPFGSDRSFNINNVDFGLVYRPETSIRLTKEISSIELRTSSGSSLMKIYFKDATNEDGTLKIDPITQRVQRTIDNDKSINIDNTQYLANEADRQGFAYINIDESILQGCQIFVEYEFRAENVSEVDRIGRNLDALNNERKAETDPPAAQIATERLRNTYYGPDYRTLEKTMTTNGTNNYYGTYLGNTYFSNEVTENDIIVKLKVDKILDYVDNDFTFRTSDNIADDHFWATITDEVLKEGSGNGAYLRSDLFNENSKLVDRSEKEREYNNEGRNNLAVSLTEFTSSGNTVLNKKLARFLEPRNASNEGTDNYYGEIKLSTSRVNSSQTDSDDMNYQNMAEIIQYTSVNGRKTGFDSTIGNLKSNGDGEYTESYKENDSSATEVITLSPPTGLNETQKVIVNTVDYTKKVVILIIAALMIIIVTISTKKFAKNKK